MIKPRGDQRLKQLLKLIDKEDRHLQAVRRRLSGDQPNAPPDWLRKILQTPEGIDRLESFGAKFARLQDTLVDKVLAAVLERAGERPGAAIDNLNRAERLGLIADADPWLAARRLRNRLVHEYMEDAEVMAAALTEAFRFTDTLHQACETIAAYARRIMQ